MQVPVSRASENLTLVKGGLDLEIVADGQPFYILWLGNPAVVLKA